MPPFYRSRENMDVETHEVYLHCRGMELEAQQADSPQEPAQGEVPAPDLFDLEAYGPMNVGL